MRTLIDPRQISTLARRLCAAAVLAAAMTTAGAAFAADIHVFTSGAPAEVEKVLAGQFARETGHHVVFTVAPPTTIRQKLAAGETPDVIVLPAPAIDALEKAGALRPGSRVDLARVGIGVVVRDGAPLPDISTVEAVRKLLADARSIVYPDPTGGGQTGAALTRMLAQLGVADAVKPKLTLMQAIAGGVALVARGEAEVGMFNISEILPVKGARLVGPLPSELQSYITFAAAIPAGNAAPAPAQAFIKWLSGPGAREHWKAGGLESLGGGG
jgi:molybdate transport system substrate-binding protein